MCRGERGSHWLCLLKRLCADPQLACRTQARFHGLLREYESVDPSFGAHRPTQPPVPGKQHMCAPFSPPSPLHTSPNTYAGLRICQSSMQTTLASRSSSLYTAPSFAARIRTPHAACREQKEQAKDTMDVDVQQHPQGVLDEASDRFMNGRVHSLLVECGFCRMPKSFLKESQEDHTHGGLDVHIPGEDEVPVQIYYRNQYEKGGTPAPPPQTQTLMSLSKSVRVRPVAACEPRLAGSAPRRGSAAGWPVTAASGVQARRGAGKTASRRATRWTSTFTISSWCTPTPTRRCVLCSLCAALIIALPVHALHCPDRVIVHAVHTVRLCNGALVRQSE